MRKLRPRKDFRRRQVGGHLAICFRGHSRRCAVHAALLLKIDVDRALVWNRRIRAKLNVLAHNLPISCT